MSVGEPFLDRTPGFPDVRGFVHRPVTDDVGRGDRRGGGLVLTHGAGSSAASPLLVALASAFAGAGFTVLRCDLPFRQHRATGPPSPRGAATDRVGLHRAAMSLRAIVSGRVFLGGHSYGGRQASMLLAREPDLAAGLLLLAYPLHPPARPDERRTAHLAELRRPALFVHGTSDPFGSVAELREALAGVPAPTRLVAVEGAGHSLARGRGDALATLAATVVTEFVAFMGTPVRRARGA